MSDQVHQELENLKNAVDVHESSIGEELVRTIVPAVDDLVLWIDYFRGRSNSGTALELLQGVQAAGLEVVACSYFGLGRAAVTAIRLQLDLLLGYTYFKDHLVEWNTLKRSGDGFQLVSEILKYHIAVDQTLNSRLGYLKNKSQKNKSYRLIPEIYRILSGHVHGQSPYTLPNLGPLESTVLNKDLMKSIVEMQLQSIMALSHYLVAVYAKQWPDLPAKFVREVSEILTSRERSLLFSD